MGWASGPSVQVLDQFNRAQKMTERNASSGFQLDKTVELQGAECLAFDRGQIDMLSQVPGLNHEMFDELLLLFFHLRTGPWTEI